MRIPLIKPICYRTPMLNADYVNHRKVFNCVRDNSRNLR